MHPSTAPPPGGQHAGRVAPDLVRPRREPDLHRHARAAEMTRDHEAVAAVVAAAADDDRAAAWPPEVLAEDPYGARSRPLHEHVAGRAVLDRPAIEGSHLGGGDDGHVAPASAAFISRTATARPTTTARAMRL